MKIISLAYDFISYLFYNIDREKISKIILFGSVVRENTDNNSDIDIFIETKHDIKKDVDRILDKFYNSSKYLDYWKPLNIKNQFSIITGRLSEFPDLERSIISNGIVMHSPYNKPIKGKNYSLLTLEFKGDFNKKISIWRKLYGNEQTKNNKVYRTKGIIEENGGKKLTRGVFIVPIENSNNILKEKRKLKIKYKVYDITSDTL